MIKRIVFILAVTVAAVSCLEKGTYSENGPIAATFEFAGVDYSTLFGADSLFFDEQYKIGISWSPLSFYHKVNKDTSIFEGGFIISYLSVPYSGITTGLKNNEYRVNCKGLANGINTYAVFHQTDNMPEHDIEYTLASSDYASSSCMMGYCFVNNTVAAADSVKKLFAPGDKMTLKAIGYYKGAQTGVADIVLAERTTEKDSIICAWTEFNLSKLGVIDYVDFEIDVPEGKNIPTTVCVDNLVASVSIAY